MLLTLTIDGGIASFPGLREPRTLDVDRLPASQRDRLCRLVHAVSGMESHSTSAPPDARTYVLDIEDGGKRTSLCFHDPIGDERVSVLVRAVRDALAER